MKKILSNFKCGKNYVDFLWKSDAMKAGVELLATPLSNMLKAFIMHGFAPEVFLACTLLPIVKDGNGIKSNSDNYRLIAISSLLLKLFDNTLLDLAIWFYEKSFDSHVHMDAN